MLHHKANMLLSVWMLMAGPTKSGLPVLDTVENGNRSGRRGWVGGTRFRTLACAGVIVVASSLWMCARRRQRGRSPRHARSRRLGWAPQGKAGHAMDGGE